MSKHAPDLTSLNIPRARKGDAAPVAAKPEEPPSSPPAARILAPPSSRGPRSAPASRWLYRSGCAGTPFTAGNPSKTSSTRRWRPTSKQKASSKLASKPAQMAAGAACAAPPTRRCARSRSNSRSSASRTRRSKQPARPARGRSVERSGRGTLRASAVLASGACASSRRARRRRWRRRRRVAWCWGGGGRALPICGPMRSRQRRECDGAGGEGEGGGPGAGHRGDVGGGGGSLRGLAEGLDARGIAAPRGGRWSAAQVARVEARMRGG